MESDTQKTPERVERDTKVPGLSLRHRGRVSSWHLAYRTKAGIAPDLRIHDLRRGFASAGVAAGLSLEAVGQLLGHRHAQTTKRYAYLVQEAALLASEAVSAQINGPRP